MILILFVHPSNGSLVVLWFNVLLPYLSDIKTNSLPPPFFLYVCMSFTPCMRDLNNFILFVFQNVMEFIWLQNYLKIHYIFPWLHIINFSLNLCPCSVVYALVHHILRWNDFFFQLLAADPALKRFKSHKQGVRRLKVVGDVLTVVVVAGMFILPQIVFPLLQVLISCWFTYFNKVVVISYSDVLTHEFIIKSPW